MKKIKVIHLVSSYYIYILSFHASPLSSNMNRRVNSMSHLTHLLLSIISLLYTSTEAATQELLKGFKATPNPSVSLFQPLLDDSTGNFSLGFLRVNQTQIALAVLHVPSSEPVWLANPAHLARWSDRTELFFNGSLVISDPHATVVWSTKTEGDKVVLLNSSNLQIQKLGNSPGVLWQSFNFPTNTLVENQNFTSTMSLVSSNGLYSMRLGDNFIGLYAAFRQNSDQIYWRRRALQAKAKVIEGQGPIYAQVHSDGYLGMYQTTSTPVDVQSFNSFQRPETGLLRVRLEPNGNLKGYYWDGSSWVLDYQAISESCDLPNPCGSYGLCKPGFGCSCLDNRTEFTSGACFSSQSGDFCAGEVDTDDFWVLRRRGVELPFKELMRYEATSSLEQCEDFCEKNCSCWGATYNNASGFCYLVDYPIQTLVVAGDESKMGYFKVRELREGAKKIDAGLGVGFGVMGVAILVSVGIVGFFGYRIWKRKRATILEEENGQSPGPYKNLRSTSFGSIEMETRY